MGIFLFISLPSLYSLEARKQGLTTKEGNESQEMVLMEDDDEDERAFWETPVPHTPEARLEAHRYVESKKKAKENRYMNSCNFFPRNQ